MGRRLSKSSRTLYAIFDFNSAKNDDFLIGRRHATGRRSAQMPKMTRSNDEDEKCYKIRHCNAYRSERFEAISGER